MDFLKLLCSESRFPRTQKEAGIIIYIVRGTCFVLRPGLEILQLTCTLTNDISTNALYYYNMISIISCSILSSLVQETIFIL